MAAQRIARRRRGAARSRSSRALGLEVTPARYEQHRMSLAPPNRTTKGAAPPPNHRLRLPVLGSTGLSGISAAAIVRPSSLRRLKVDAALRWGSSRPNRQPMGRDGNIDELTESCTSSWMPRLEMYSRMARGGGMTVLPVPRRRISGGRVVGDGIEHRCTHCQATTAETHLAAG